MADILDFLDIPVNKDHVHRILADVILDCSPHTSLMTVGVDLLLRSAHTIFKDDTGAGVLVHGRDEQEESVFEVAGVLVQHTLPPILSRNQIPKEKPYLASQSVTIAGLGAECFLASIHAVCNIHTMFSTRYRNLLPFSMETGPSGPFLSFASWYVTTLKATDRRTGLPFGKAMDPRGVLQEALERKGVHTEDNQVLYFEGLHGERPRQWSFKPCSPDIFAVGQVVQLQVAFGVVPCCGGGKFQMVANNVPVPRMRPLRACGIRRRAGYGLQEPFTYQGEVPGGSYETCSSTGK
ncbi:hypothetical protein EVG20_g11212 [Dentipellis fragilis]|uniref:Uncharacterized protein n=1 Tax=Dentipellis fragilis TaxID=205917 RepID=A0A4Y9XMM3_9AGAM|nr:hypothetical protein EVG20_g11212 [Dentipellis fragilis]